jgi:hypothetical protein
MTRGSDPNQRKRILVEDPDSAWYWAVRDSLSNADYDVAWCPGPSEEHIGCPLVADGWCPIVPNVDLVLQSFDLSLWASRAVLRRLREDYGASRIAVLLAEGTEHDWPELTAGCWVATYPISEADLATFVDGIFERTLTGLSSRP